MAYDVAGDIRLDPRLKAMLAGMPSENPGDVESREALLAEANSPAAQQRAEAFSSFLELCDTEENAPRPGCGSYTEKVVSAPDGNSINLQVIRPDNDEELALRLLHPRRWHGLDVVLRRHVPRLGQDHRGQRRGRRDGGLPQLACRRRRCPRWRRSRPGSTTACPG